TMEASRFKVIIVGGSVAGLTLAHCLHRANIDYIILEKGNQIAPEAGASIGIMPNGARILEQLGLFTKIEIHVEPLSQAHITYPDGFSFSNPYPKILHQRFGFPLAFLTRKRFLEVVYECLPDKKKVLTEKKVIEMRRLKSGICAVTHDGSVYEGSLIVGADGVHSQVRSEIWRMADEDQYKRISAREKGGMIVEYACVFGISSQINNLNAGEQINAFLDGAAVMTIHGKNGRVFWFIFKKLDRKYTYPAVPRFSADDAAEICDKLRDVHLYKGLYVRDIWRNREIATMAALEEGLFKTWFYDRAVLMGDSVHKRTASQMTPNFGQGANCAIEDAAALASLLHNLIYVNQTHELSDQQIVQALQEYQNARYTRMQHLYKDSWTVCRLHARDGLFNRLLGRYYAPYAANLPADMASRAYADGETIQFLSLPGRTGPGWTKYSRRRKYHTFPYVLVALLLALIAQALLS
ncbi:hypothetical protein ARAM_006151, partial [Aspergillus rambellii]